MSLGILSDPTLPFPILLDTVRHAETGHLSLDQARNARSRAGAIGPYQFLERFLPEFGYGMPANIPVADVQDPARARELAGQYITGYSLHHDFTTPLQKLVAYNMGPSAAAKWIAAGENIEDLPRETQQYITRAAAYLTQNQQPNTEEPQMADTLFGLPFDPSQAAVLSQMADQGNPMASATMEQILREQMNRDLLAKQQGQAPVPPGGALSTAANAQTSQPALTTVTSTPANQAPAAASGSGGLVIPITQSYATSRTPNRRDMSALSMPVQQQGGIGLNEYLIRMGAAGLEGSAEGGLQALGAIGKTYGELRDAERKGLEAYNKALTKGSKSTDDDAAKQIGQIDEALFDMERALQFLQAPGASVTGILDGTIMDAYDRATGNPDRARRLLLQKLRVDDALLRVAQTKGAISNKEMELFLAPAPSTLDDESVWIQWIGDRQRALTAIRQRLATGQTVQNPASANQVNQFGSSMPALGVGQSTTIGGQTITRIK